MAEETTPERPKPSPIPSWVMLGFVLGVLVTLGWQRDNPAPSSPPPQPAPAEPPPPSPATERNALHLEDQPSLTAVEALFEQYRAYAFWDDDRTEIGVWNTRTLEFSSYFEVHRAETGTYFRSIPALTRLPLEGYGPPGSPLLFTETPAQRAARYLEARGQLKRTGPLPNPPANAP